jgi:hypothetical protein
MAKRAHAKYCSNECRRGAYEERHPRLILGPLEGQRTRVITGRKVRLQLEGLLNGMERPRGAVLHQLVRRIVELFERS